MSSVREYPKREFLSRQELRDWLEANHATADTFWLVSYKKHVTDRYVPYGHIVEELLCFGWIDSRTRRVDDERTMLLVGPRKPGSTWSASNKKRAAKLTTNGLMTAAGQMKIDAAKKDGSWHYLDDIENLVIPDDLAAALQVNSSAKENFESFNDSAKKVILMWIKSAKREETRERRLATLIRDSASGKTIGPLTRPTSAASDSRKKKK